MNALGYQKPIFCGEYNGPSFFNFALNLPILQTIFAKMTVNPKGNTLAQATQSEAVASLYQQMKTLPRRPRCLWRAVPLNWRKSAIVSTAASWSRVASSPFQPVFAKILCWNLANEKVDRLNLMHLLFDKYKLLDYENGVFKQPYPGSRDVPQNDRFFWAVNPFNISNCPNIQPSTCTK